MKILNTELIKKAEEDAVKSGIFSYRELMFNAGKSAAEIILDRFVVKNKNIFVVCGKGNNGGDGCVIAEILAEAGGNVTVVTPLGAPVTENGNYYYNKLFLSKKTDKTDFKDADIIIDALFGIGLDRPLGGKALETVKSINEADCLKISVDIPSGVHSDTGKILEDCVNADLTVTFIALKPCFVLPSGSDYCGETAVADIGITPTEYTYRSTEKPQFEKRKHNSHKGTFGTALLICGSYGMAGAAILSAKAAVRSGAGIVKAIIPESIYAPFTCSVPEAVCIPAPQTENGVIDADKIDIPDALKGVSAVLIGCGCKKDLNILKIIKKVLEYSIIPVVIDADGINSLADDISIIKNCKAPVILTPHPGEMSRLTSLSVKEIEEDRVSAAADFVSKTGCTLVFKGANTIIAAPDEKMLFNMTGNPGMAKGGSGDLLSGITVSLLATGLPPFKAAEYAVYLHGECGDKAAEKHGERSMTPSDMIEVL